MPVILRYIKCKLGEGVKILGSFFGFLTEYDTNGKGVFKTF